MVWPISDLVSDDDAQDSFIFIRHPMTHDLPPFPSPFCEDNLLTNRLLSCLSLAESVCESQTNFMGVPGSSTKLKPSKTLTILGPHEVVSLGEIPMPLCNMTIKTDHH
jgi:hypothetical protein